jgi:hypothetical protein
MKTRLLLLIAFIFISCEKEEIELCECYKTNYERVLTFVHYPATSIRTFYKEISIELVPCQDEQERTLLYDKIYYKIECDKIR